MLFHRIVSTLLGYPDADLRAALPEIGAAIDDANIDAEERATLDSFLERLSATEPLALEEDYVRTFDMVPEHSLHLTHHLIGEDKNRGPALIDLAEYYKEYGIEIAQKELPDYLPLMLEFVSVLEEEEGRMFLSRWNKALRQVRANLAEAGSPYADLLALVERRSRLVEASEDVVTPAAANKSNPLLDDGDFDPPVNWNAPPSLASECNAQRC